ncbi:Protein of unknown function (DUF3667) [Owenweeksia hongkongensis DSM 17368]|uniref:DUF3667 domain-containing protein n=1 Tax=Owenweeksia hongkongensis (strain DSM 17368 / CIP 108786 / JCM 12287 / NRRL B-23963 / UST20020801) TaxID=926562 RepID=G8R5N3_OWEHD|nr:DUF3667 domain-containing protein [Owenweeksia hongkongensis]AEV34349.1 Protein of unknown function (DUF3667) [Owenweeksia hongkongensis DSM 17368]
MSKKVVKTEICPNCHTSLQGENFCPNCGQKNDSRKLTFWHFITETLSHFLAFDGKFFTTLKTLVTKPGQVPLEFKEGQRTRHMNPLRIYFLSSLLFLFISQVQSDKSQERIKDIETNEQLSKTERDSAVTSELDAIPGIPLSLAIDSSSEDNILLKLEDMTEYSKDHSDVETATALNDLQMDNTFINRFLYHQADKLSHFELEEYNKYFRAKIFWVLFFFLPIIALILKLLYIRKNVYYTDHLFFAFYSQSAFFLLLSISGALGENSMFSLIASIVFLLYLFLSMKRFYQQGLGKTILKFCLLNLIAIPAFFAFFLVSLVVVFLIF